MSAAFDHATIFTLLRDQRLEQPHCPPRPAPDHLTATRALEADALLELKTPSQTRLGALAIRAFTSRWEAMRKTNIQKRDATMKLHLTEPRRFAHSDRLHRHDRWMVAG